MQISIANIIRGTLIGNTMSVLTRYISRVVNGGGIVESPQCVETALNSQPLLQQASLLVVPSGYKGGTLYSEIPTNGNGDLTWTRGSDAFRTNASGLIQRVPWNLLQRSEEFENAVWTKINTSITANTTATIDPSGGNNADKFIANNNNAAHFVAQTGFTSGVYTFSVYAKAAEETSMSLWLRSASVGATFNLSNGTVSNISVTSATITSVGNGWYRCSVYDSTAGTSGHIYGRNGSGYVGNNVDGFFIWGAQLVEGTTAQTYLPTTDRLNFPRLSYMYGSCPAVLLEPQRTNLALQSGNFADSSWIALNSTKVSTTQTDPSATNTALNVTWSSGGSKYFYRSQSGLTIGTTYTLSFYVKSSNASKFRIYAESLGFTTSNLTSTSDFARYTLTFTATVTAGTIGLQAASDNTSADLIVAFAQLEAGAYPTTYIPTTSATATRVTDSFSRNNIFTNGLITSSGGTWFVELRNNVAYLRDSQQFVGIGSTTALTTNSLVINNPSINGRLLLLKCVSGSFTQLWQTTTDIVKFAIKWNGTTADVFVNGTKVLSATSFTPTNMENLCTAGMGTPVFIQQMALYPTPLTDTQCQTLTTL